MIARELEEFFATFSPDGRPCGSAPRRPGLPLQRQRVLRARLLGGDPLSRRALRRGPGLRRRPARRRMAQGLPPGRGGAARPRLRLVGLHAPLLRRVPRPARDHRSRRAVRGPLASPGTCGARWPATAAGWPAQGASARRSAPLGGSPPPPTTAGRRVFSALGSRAERLPAPVRRPLSLERRDDALVPAGSVAAPPVPGTGRLARRDDAAAPSSTSSTTSAGRGLARRARRRCCDPVPGLSERPRLRIAMVIPPFSRGSGGHNAAVPDPLPARAPRAHLHASGCTTTPTVPAVSAGACCAATSTNSSHRSGPGLQRA